MILLQMLDVEREKEFIQTMITAKAATIDRTSESEIKVYNDLLSDYRTLMFNLGRKTDDKDSTEDEIMESDLRSLIGKAGKERKIVMTANAENKVNQDIESISIKNIKDITK